MNTLYCFIWICTVVLDEELQCSMNETVNNVFCESNEAEGWIRHCRLFPPRHRPYLADEKNLITFKNLVLSLLRNICYLQSVAGPSPRLMKPRRSRGRPTAVLLPKHRTKGHQTRIITKRYKAWRSYSRRLDWGGLWAVKHPRAATATGRFNYTENIRLFKELQ